ncbi:MAG TPA: tRNA lysidine(34) synthetase TilS [Acidimicrobiales bacterium]|nr:tRNA lysidine(34) synthetase TilS [Acidimicrobiales bacterium]
MTAAVSGGPDSLALLLLACAAGCRVEVVHVDHGLRPGSDSDADVVRAAAARFAVPVTVHRVEVPAGANLEARARAARYAVLPAGVLVGHTADDQAETVLLNLLRGAGLDGLAAMAGADDCAVGSHIDHLLHNGPPVAGPPPAPRVRRPLLGLRRAETEALCAAAGWDPVRDPTNDDLRFRRNQVRHRLLPLLAEVGGRDPVPVLGRQAALLAEEAALLDRLASEIDPCDARALAAAPVALARRAVRDWLRSGGDAEAHPPSGAEVTRVLAVARGDAVGTELSGARRVRRSAGRLRVESPAPGPAAEAGHFPQPGLYQGERCCVDSPRNEGPG